MAQSARDSRGARRRTGQAERPPTAEASSVIDLKSLKRDAFHIVDLGGIPHAIRWTSDDFLELYEVVEG